MVCDVGFQLLCDGFRNTLFLCCSMIVIMKKLGLKEYLADTWNLADIFTLLLSFLAFALYIILKMSIIALQNQVS